MNRWVGIALGCGIVAVTAGCSDRDPICDDDPATWPPEAGCGIFASSSLGDDTNPGTPGEPVKSLRRAVELARKERHRVYACAETFTDRVFGNLDSGDASIWGGFDCTHGWRYLGAEAKTVMAPQDPAPIQVVELFKGDLTLANLRIVAPEGGEPLDLEASMALYIGASVRLKLVASEIVAGRGAAAREGRAAREDAAAWGPAVDKG